MSNVREQLPPFHYFEVGNDYSGSEGKRRYKIIANREEKAISFFVYEGDFCYEIAKERNEILFEQAYELSSEGFEKMKNDLEKKMENAVGN